MLSAYVRRPNTLLSYANYFFFVLFPFHFVVFSFSAIMHIEAREKIVMEFMQVF